MSTSLPRLDQSSSWAVPTPPPSRTRTAKARARAQARVWSGTASTDPVCVPAPEPRRSGCPTSTSGSLALLAEPARHPYVSRSLIHRHVPGRLAERADHLAGDGPVGPQPGHRARHRTSDPPVHSGVSQPRASASSITARPTKRLPPSSSSLVRRMLGVPGITGNRFREQQTRLPRTMAARYARPACRTVSRTSLTDTATCYTGGAGSY